MSTSPLTALCRCAEKLVSKHGFANKKKSRQRKGVKDMSDETITSKSRTKCMICQKKIYDTDFEYEDYYQVVRGHTPNAVEGHIHFDCYQNWKGQLSG